MATYTIVRHVSYAETYVVHDVDSFEEAEELIEAGEIDCRDARAVGEDSLSIVDIEGRDECGTTPPELHASHCSAFGIPDESRPGLTCRHCGQTITRDLDNDWIHAADEVVGCGAPFGEQDPRTAEPTPEDAR